MRSSTRDQLAPTAAAVRAGDARHHDAGRRAAPRASPWGRERRPGSPSSAHGSRSRPVPSTRPLMRPCSGRHRQVSRRLRHDLAVALQRAGDGRRSRGCRGRCQRRGSDAGESSARGMARRAREDLQHVFTRPERICRTAASHARRRGRRDGPRWPARLPLARSPTAARAARRGAGVPSAAWAAGLASAACMASCAGLAPGRVGARRKLDLLRRGGLRLLGGRRSAADRFFVLRVIDNLLCAYNARRLAQMAGNQTHQFRYQRREAEVRVLF